MGGRRVSHVEDRRHLESPHGGCVACGTRETPQWRSTPSGKMCNKCGTRTLYAELKKHRAELKKHRAAAHRPHHARAAPSSIVVSNPMTNDRITTIAARCATEDVFVCDAPPHVDEIFFDRASFR